MNVLFFCFIVCGLKAPNLQPAWGDVVQSGVQLSLMILSEEEKRQINVMDCALKLVATLNDTLELDLYIRPNLTPNPHGMSFSEFYSQYSSRPAAEIFCCRDRSDDEFAKCFLNIYSKAKEFGLPFVNGTDDGLLVSAILNSDVLCSIKTAIDEESNRQQNMTAINVGFRPVKIKTLVPLTQGIQQIIADFMQRSAVVGDVSASNSGTWMNIQLMMLVIDLKLSKDLQGKYQNLNRSINEFRGINRLSSDSMQSLLDLVNQLASECDYMENGNFQETWILDQEDIPSDVPVAMGLSIPGRMLFRLIYIEKHLPTIKDFIRDQQRASLDQLKQLFDRLNQSHEEHVSAQYNALIGAFRSFATRVQAENGTIEGIRRFEELALTIATRATRGRNNPESTRYPESVRSVDSNDESVAG